ncbi:hypothetical protein KAR91_87950 [Candidatus Pacearchaeota archaeon]|nr:hypothetical protein [Candidatus Pacearchaeota archaeon]
MKSDTGRTIDVYQSRWLDVPPVVRPGSDLQRKYTACILSLEKMRERKMYNFKLKVEGKLINEQLAGKRSTGTMKIAELRSELHGLMTRMGVTIERNEIRQSKQTEERE